MQGNDTRDPGTYVEIDGRPAVRFERRYAHPQEHVWQALTDPGQLRHWFPSPEVSFQPYVDGTITFAGDPYAESPTTGRVTAWDPPHRFGFEWGPDELVFALTADGDGCRLELVNFLAETGSAARNAAGWEVCLEELRRTVDGAPGAGAHGADTLDFRPLLERYKAQGLPDDGWLPDGV